MDLLIKHIPPQTRSYVRDDIDFLPKLTRNLDLHNKYILTTFDVESLYTNIDNELGITAIKYWIQKCPELIHPRFSEEFITDSIKFILENNTFHFNDNYYLQVKGTAMGTKMAPTYANLVLAYLEENLYSKVNETKGTEFMEFIQTNFLRYLDDCFIIWPNSKYNIDEFTKDLNNMHPKLNFIQESSLNEIPFLDIKVLLNNNQVSTDIYYKPTDTHHFLPFNSSHPRHTKVSIPYSQARRLCTIIDDELQLKNRLNEMKDFFLLRGYPSLLIDDSIKKALDIPKNVLRQAKSKEKTDVLPFVHTHNPNNKNLVPIVRSTLEILKHDSQMKKVLAKTTFISSKRQPPNLGKLLTRAKFTNQSTKTGSYKCQNKRCRHCPYVNETQTLKIKATGKTFYIKHFFTCKTQNVLYAITCNGCGEQYIGMTNSTLQERFRVHRQQIDNPVYRQIGASKHLNECSTDKIKFNVTPFFKISSDKTQGQIKESLFIKQFEPKLNKLSLT